MIGSTGRRSTRRGRRASLVAIALLVGATPGSVLAAGARVRWLPSADRRVVGYHLYVRPAGSRYGGPLDLGNVVPGADGTSSSVVEGLVAGRTYHIAVAGYAADGVETALSGELTLGAIDACVVDSCSSPSACDFGVVADGAWCPRDGETDPCMAIGACAAGECTANAASTRLASTRLRIVVRRHEGWLTVHGHFPVAAGFDPRTAGATLELADATGALLYRATIPGDLLERGRGGTAFQYLATRRAAREHGGLRVVNVFVSGRTAGVTVRAEAVELRAASAQPTVRVTLRFGDTCARDLALECRVSRRGVLSCR